MAELSAVVFDYGDTLMQFRYDRATHARSLGLVAEHLGAGHVAGDQLFAQVDGRLAQAMRARGAMGELDYVAVVREALAALGVEATAAEVVAAMRPAQRAWVDCRELHPATVEMLQALRERGLAIGLVSNTVDPPEVMLDDFELLGIAGLVDVPVFSSQLGIRKPHPAIYRCVLDGLGVEPQQAMFVGDRLLEDVIGPSRAGMATCLAVYFRQDEGDRSQATHIAEHPLDVVSIVDGAGHVPG